MKKYLPIIALMLCAPLLRAQSLELRESWYMNEKLLDLVDSYERFSSFERRSDASSYLDLFVAPNAKVWCDYLSSELFGRYVTARDYVDMSKDLAYRSVTISNLRKHDFVMDHDDWHVRVEFDKRVNYEDGLGFTFSTQSKQAGGDFHIALDCLWMPKESAFRIEKVVGSSSAARNFPSGTFRIVKRQEEIDPMLRYNGKPIEYNDYGFAILPSSGEFSLVDDDYRLGQEVVPGKGRYEVCSFTAQPKIFRVRPRMSLLINPVTVKTSYGTQLQPLSLGIEAGVDFGAVLKLGGGFNYVPYIGVGLEHSWTELKSTSISGGRSTKYTYLDRDYKFRATERIAFDDFVLSLSPASFEYEFGNGLVAAAEAGVKFYFNMLATDVYSIKFSSPADVNIQHGSRNVEELPLSTDKGLNHYWIASVFAKGGVDYKFGNGSLLFCHLGVENGMGSYSGTFKNVIYSNSNPVSWFDEEAGIYPVVYRVNDGTVQDIKDHTFKSSIKSVRRRVAGIVEFGVKFKF